MKKSYLLMACTLMLCAFIGGCNTSQVKQDSVENPTETVENSVEQGNKISPLPVTIDMNDLNDCTVAISLEKGDAYVDDTGAMQMDVTVYTHDLYDMVDMATLKEGDVIVINGNEVLVTSIERREKWLLINGGLDENGYDFTTDDTTVWYQIGYSDAKSYYELGKATIRVSADMNFYDTSDLERGEVIYYPGDFLTDLAGIEYYFVPHNTSIVIQDGKIIEMHRRFIP